MFTEGNIILKKRNLEYELFEKPDDSNSVIAMLKLKDVKDDLNVKWLVDSVKKKLKTKHLYFLIDTYIDICDVVDAFYIENDIIISVEFCKIDKNYDFLKFIDKYDNWEVHGSTVTYNSFHLDLAPIK